MNSAIIPWYEELLLYNGEIIWLKFATMVGSSLQLSLGDLKWNQELLFIEDEECRKSQECPPTPFGGKTSSKGGASHGGHGTCHECKWKEVGNVAVEVSRRWSTSWPTLWLAPWWTPWWTPWVQIWPKLLFFILFSFISSGELWIIEIPEKETKDRHNTRKQ